jgi:hypothetical protein
MTEDQRQLFEESLPYIRESLDLAEQPGSGPTPEQALNLAVDSFMWACDFDTEPRPDEAELRAAIRSRLGVNR